MKNKIVACLLVLSMLCVGFMFTGCSETAAEVVEPAFDNSLALDDYKATLVVSVKSDNETQPVDESVTTEIELSGKKMYVKTGVTGDEKKASEYYTDGEYVYSYIGKMGNKKKLTKDNALTYAEDLEKIFLAPDSADLEELEVVENDDGTKSVSIAIPDEELNENYAEIVSATSVFSAANTTVVLYGGKLDVVINEAGYIVSYKLSCKTDRTWIGQQLVHDVTFDISFDQPGAEVTVTDLTARDIKFIELNK